MANYANLKATINANIKANGNEEITGPILNTVLNQAVTTLGAGYQYMGVATPATSPGTPDANVFYIAATPGTYTNFGGKVVADGEVAILKYNGSWTKEVSGAATAAQVTQLGRDVYEVGYEKQTAVESANAYLTGNVGSTINKTSNASYKWQKVYGNPGDVFFLDLYRREETFWWVYYVDANDVIVARDLSSSSTNYGWVEKYRAVIPEGASAMYFQSYNRSAYPLSMAAYYTGVSAKDTIYDIQEQISVLPALSASVDANAEAIEQTNLLIKGDAQYIQEWRGYISKNVGAAIAVSSNLSYRTLKFAVTPGDIYYIDIYRRNETFWWVYFSDASDIVTERQVKSTSSDYGTTLNQKVVVPTGAVYMYVQSYILQGSILLNVKIPEQLHDAIYNLRDEIEHFEDIPAVLGDESEYLARNNAYISTAVGSTLSQTANTSYRNQKYSVTPGDKYFISIYRRNETFWWVYFTDANEVVISRQVQSSTTDYGHLTDYKITVPDGAVYMYVQSYILQGVFTLNVEPALSVKNKLKDIDAELKDGETLPDFVLSEGRTTYKRLLKWASGAVVSTLGQITDVHAGSSEKYKCVGYLDGLKDLFGFSALVNAGDIGLDVGETEDAAYTLIENTKRGMSANTLWMFCKGNHDYGTATISNGIIDDAFNAPYGRRFQDRIAHVRTSSTYGYGYTDDKFAKVRYIYLNTSEGNTGAYIMTSAQVSWLISVLNDTPAGYAIVVLTHLCIDAIGRWASYPTDADANCFVALRSIFPDFIARSSGSSTAVGVSWDFSNAQAKLACVLSGDSHFDNYVKRNGVNYIVRQGYGSVSSSERPQGSVYTQFDWETQCLFDVLAVNVGGSVGKVFRIGAGGAGCDLEFTF